MKRNLAALADREHDLVIVGGGAFGCCAAWDAASRGLSVALVDKDDFCAATSANHLKMVHGGIRYLQHLDFKRVRDSIRERSALLRIAPHLVRPVPIVMPTYGRGMEGRLVLRSGLFLYDLVACDRNRGLEDPSRRIPRGRLISRKEVLDRYPGLQADGLTGAGVFYDGQYYNPPRLALAFLRSAVDAGAEVANYVEVEGFLREKDRVFGVAAKDRFTGERFEIRGRVVLNTAGPWAVELLRESLGLRPGEEPAFSRDTGLVLRGRLTGDHALACRVGTKDPDAVLSRRGRHVFLVPWRDHTLVGVWHKVHETGPDEFRVEEEEIQSYLDEVNACYPSLDLGLEDVSMVYAGLILFGENRPGAKNLRFGKRSMLIDHAEDERVDGLLTLIGVRATTARGMAAKAVDKVVAKLGGSAAPSRTFEVPVHGGDIERFDDFLQDAVERHSPVQDRDVLSSLVHNYGTEYETILEYARRDPALGETAGSSTTLKAQVVHAVREEMAHKLTDVVLRRTDLGSGGHPGDAEIRACADVMESEMDWTEARKRDEIQEVEACFPRSMASRT